ncbi:MAG: PEP/pyruvate-binding domain-containing protein [Bacteroidota bacterium]|nr:PEP/pyruvate-binding domain-containing protein [Bacteroidota bacterium]
MNNYLYQHFRKFHFTETAFNKLMSKRIYKVLLVCSRYDAFILEEDGRIDEQLFNEYVSLNLRYPPEIIQVSTAEDAIVTLKQEKINLVINMLSVEDMDPFDLSYFIKESYPTIPIVVLSPFSREISDKLETIDKRVFDYVFSWLGDVAILLAIIKLLEDKRNVEYDVNYVGVQTVILVEDSVRYYSSYLPTLYKVLIQQAKQFTREGLNEHQKMLRMRGRPKILLATSYEEAVFLYEKYKNNLLGVISDIRYPRKGKLDPEAGFRLAEMIKEENKLTPMLLQSSNYDNLEKTRELGAHFMHKYSKTLLHELKDFVTEYFAFGDFIFFDPDTGKEVARVSSLKDLQECIFDIPDKTILDYADLNQFSRWLKARALFPIADILHSATVEDFSGPKEIKKYIYDAIAWYRYNKGRGIIAKFYRENYDEYLMFTRMGDGSLGGKARGLAFIDNLISRNELTDRYENVLVTIPRTLVITTDLFDDFMESNDLLTFALEDTDDKKILKKFVEATLPEHLVEDLRKFIEVVQNPIAVRSSSLLEDSHYQPFAGIYNTYMIPSDEDINVSLDMLKVAVKSVYASVYFQDSKAYMNVTKNVIDEEKMGVVLQELCGKRHGDIFYPTISGVARSINFYPIDKERSEDGIVNLAFGLGQYVVDGGLCLRFSPKHSRKILQLSSTGMALRETQKKFLALDMNKDSFTINTDDGVNLIKEDIKTAMGDDMMKHVVSTFDYNDNVLRDGISMSGKGKAIVSFANILKHNYIPLAEIISDVIKIGQREMNNPVEIEFAVCLNVPDEPIENVFNLLQIRPIVDNQETINLDLKKVDKQKTIMVSDSALGNGIYDDIKHIVYVKPETFNPANNPKVAEIIGKINDEIQDKNEKFILIGPGRWGSIDPWLGIPVRWAQISAARVMVEAGIKNYHVDPSQGTHFFQNLTSFHVGYFTVNTNIDEGYYHVEYLNEQPAVYEDEYLRHIEFDKPVQILIDGKKNQGVIMKAGEDFNRENDNG